MESISVALGADRFSIDIDETWSVADVKHYIGKSKFAQSTTENNSFNSIQNLKVIFCGQLVNDEQKVKDLGLGSQSLLHVVASKTSTQTCREDAGASTSPAGDQATTSRTRRHTFYVFCKSRCGAVAPAKLRVVCSACSSSCFLLSREPGCWQDVLQQGRVTGTCQAPGCPSLDAPVNAVFYFKCGVHAAAGEGEREAVLPLIQQNTPDPVPCSACTASLDLVLKFPCSGQHTLCLECFRQDCDLRLSERRFILHPAAGYTVPCPGGCEDGVIPDGHYFRLLGSEQYERYLRYGAEECVLGEGGMLCSTVGCGNALLPSETPRPDNRLHCTECQTDYCGVCRSAWHEADCSRPLAPPTQAGSASHTVTPQDSASKQTIRETCKKCPKCATDTERNGGCMHMQCARCGQDWCWVCLTPWSRDCMQDHWFGT